MRKGAVPESRHSPFSRRSAAFRESRGNALPTTLYARCSGLHNKLAGRKNQRFFRCVGSCAASRMKASSTHWRRMAVWFVSEAANKAKRHLHKAACCVLTHLRPPPIPDRRTTRKKEGRDAATIHCVFLHPSLETEERRFSPWQIMRSCALKSANSARLAE